MNNPMELIKAIKNPEQYVKEYLKQNSNPILNNLVQQVENGNTKSVEQFANNMLREKGTSLEDIINSIK